MSNPSSGCYAFGSYRLNAQSRVLTRSDAVVTLAPKTFDLLVLLADSGGRLLSKRELMDSLWRDTAVEEANLSFQISILRKALGEEGTTWIEAVPKHGYRFKALVQHIPATDTPEPPVTLLQPPQQTLPRSRLRLRKWWLIGAIVAALTIAAALLTRSHWRDEQKPAAKQALNPFPATTYRGRETNPSLSPDGSQIAFAWDSGEGHNFDIYVKVVGENKALRITSDLRPEFSPAWSPDGRRIAFCRDGPSGSEIVLISALGGPEQILVTLPKQTDSQLPDSPLSWYSGIGYPNTHLAWFPDGMFLAVVARAHRDEPNTVFLLSVADRGMTPLTSPPKRGWGDDSPSISPDGQWLAFTRSFAPYPEPSYLYVQPLSQRRASGEARRMVEQAIRGAGTAWTADSNRLVFRSGRALWTIGLNRKIPEPVALPGYNPLFPAISAKANRLAFVESVDDSDIWRVNGPAGRGKSNGVPEVGTRLISSTRIDTNPQYSPEGTRIAFTSARGGTFQIWVCESDGSEPVQLTDFINSEAGTPRWSPDGRFLAFDLLSLRTKNIGDVYVIPAQGGPTRRMTPGESNDDMPSWSHDGKWIYFESDRTGVFQIWKVPFAGGTAVQVTRDGGADSFESYDGKFVYYTKWHERGFWRKSAEGGGQETKVTDFGSPYLSALYDKGACLVDLKPAVTATIKCLEFESGRVTTVFTLPNGMRMNDGGPSLAISRDGRWILYVGRDRTESDIMVVDNFR